MLKEGGAGLHGCGPYLAILSQIWRFVACWCFRRHNENGGVDVMVLRR